VPSRRLRDREELVVKFEVPGVDSGRLDGVEEPLILRGDKRGEPTRKAKFHCMERGFGKFKRVVHITSPVNTHKASTALSDGVLKVTFPKVPNRRGEEVPIQIEERA
jgi:HSP20 family protein